MTMQPRKQDIEAENWDEDFLFQTTTEDDPQPATSRPGLTDDYTRRWSTATDSIAWDEDDEDEDSPQRLRARLGKAKDVVQPEDVNWGDSDDEDTDQKTPDKRARSPPVPSTSQGRFYEQIGDQDGDDDDDDKDGDDFTPSLSPYDMDKTVTLKDRSHYIQHSPTAPPLTKHIPSTTPTSLAYANSSSASLPSSSVDHLPSTQHRQYRNQHLSHIRPYSPPASPTPLPCSPSLSGFSIGDSSTAPSTAPLVAMPLRRTVSGTSSSRDSQSSPPPVSFNPPRHRRRLRKKSRPPQAEVFEMVENRLEPLRQQGFQEELQELGAGASTQQYHYPSNQTAESQDRPSAPVNAPTSMPMALTSMPELTSSAHQAGATDLGLAQDTLVPSGPSSPSVNPKPPSVPLLSRIGSMKRWSVRRASRQSLSQLAQLSPSNTSLPASQEQFAPDQSFSSIEHAISQSPSQTPEPHSQAATSPRSWIFRSVSNSTSLSSRSPSSSPEVKRRSSRIDLLARREVNDADTQSDQSQAEADKVTKQPDLPNHNPQPPSTKKQLFAKVFGLSSSPSTAPLPLPSSRTRLDAELTHGRRPASFQPQVVNSDPSSSIGPPISSFSRFAAASVGRSVSNPYVDSLATAGDGAANSINRPGLLGLRGLSTTSSSSSKHRRNKSMGADGLTNEALATNPENTVPPLPEDNNQTPVKRPRSSSRSRAGSASMSIIARPGSRSGSIRSAHRRHLTSDDVLPPISYGPPSQRQQPSLKETTEDSPPLLPPIELLPPSPSKSVESGPPPVPQLHMSSLLQLTASSSASPGRSSLLSKPALPSSPPRTGQAASLGRSNGSVLAGISSNVVGSPSSHVPHGTPARRNSLGDLTHKREGFTGLRIPDRISRVQSGIKSNMGMVKEFAGSIEQLKQLQATHKTLLLEIRQALEQNPQATAPIIPPSHDSTDSLQEGPLSKPHPHSDSSLLVRERADIALKRIDDHYALWWECADLLIELGSPSNGGRDSPTLDEHGQELGLGSRIAAGEKSPTDTITPLESGPTLSSLSLNLIAARRPSAAGVSFTGPNNSGSKGSKGRERAITLAGSESVSTVAAAASTFVYTPNQGTVTPVSDDAIRPPSASSGPPHAIQPSQWRASTGRHDLNQRQLTLLKEMLSTPDPTSLFGTSPSQAPDMLAMQRSMSEPGVEGSVPTQGRPLSTAETITSSMPTSAMVTAPQSPIEDFSGYSITGSIREVTPQPMHYRATASAVTLPLSSAAPSITSSPVIRPSQLPSLSTAPSAFDHASKRLAAGASLTDLAKSLNPAHVTFHPNHSAAETVGEIRNVEGDRGVVAVIPDNAPLPVNSSTSDLNGPSFVAPTPPKEGKLRRASRVGLMGIRDILKSLKKTSQEERERERERLGMIRPITPANLIGLPPLPPMTPSEHPQGLPEPTAGPSVSAENRPQPPAKQQQKAINYPYSSSSRKSPRRPSLASIFRLGHGKASKNMTRSGGGNTSSAADTSTTEDDYSDWDRMDSASDLDISGQVHHPVKKAERNNGTVKGKRTVTPTAPDSRPSSPPFAPYRFRPQHPHASAATSSTSLVGPITEEVEPTPHPSNSSTLILGKKSHGRNHQGLNSAKHGVLLPPFPQPAFSSVRGLPGEIAQYPVTSKGDRGKGGVPYPYQNFGGLKSMEELSGVTPLLMSSPPIESLSHPPIPAPPIMDQTRLALTPDNIKPLLEYAREVLARLSECVEELRVLAAS